MGGAMGGTVAAPGGARAAAATPTRTTTVTPNPRATTATPAARSAQSLNLGRMSVDMDPQYNLLLGTSIFSEDRRAIDVNPPRVAETRPIEVVRPPVRTDAPIFRGVATDKGGTQAVLEVQEPNMETGSIKYNALSCKPGDTFQWNGREYTVVDVSLNEGMSLLQPGAQEPIMIAMGHNIFDQAMPSLPDTPPYRSGDAQPQNTGYNTGRGARGRNARGAMGATDTTGMPGVTTGMTPITAGSSMAALQGALVSPTSDPPLPPGSADDLERRMRARSESQVAAPGGATTVSPTTIKPATPAAPKVSTEELERQLQARRDAQMAPTTAPAGG